MGKSVICPVKKFAGAVVFKDPLPYNTVVKFETAARDATAQDVGIKFLPVILEAVEKWELKNFPAVPTVDNFPGTPRKAVYELIAWLLNEMTAIYQGNEDGDPNE